MTEPAQSVLDRYFPEMRWRVLSLAADFDRVQRAAVGDAAQPWPDPRLAALRAALVRIAEPAPDRTADVQLLFSDLTPPPLLD